MCAFFSNFIYTFRFPTSNDFCFYFSQKTWDYFSVKYHRIRQMMKKNIYIIIMAWPGMTIQKFSRFRQRSYWNMKLLFIFLSGSKPFGLNSPELDTKSKKILNTHIWFRFHATDIATSSLVIFVCFYLLSLMNSEKLFWMIFASHLCENISKYSFATRIISQAIFTVDWFWGNSLSHYVR